jgi:hypothetical protein
MTITEQLKRMLDELEIERHVTEAAADLERAVITGVGRAGSLAHERRTDIGEWLERAAGAINDRTEGRYADQVAGVRSQIESGVERLAEQRSEPPAPPAPPLD